MSESHQICDDHWVVFTGAARDQKAVLTVEEPTISNTKEGV